jgi:hypothetical protein
MPLDLQYSGPTLRQLLQGVAQDAAIHHCIDPILGRIVDHVNVSPVQSTAINRDDVRFTLLVDIITTDDIELRSPGAV